MPQQSPRDTYRQVAERLRAELTGEEVLPGSRLPSEAALGRTHGISRGTVRRALEALESEGLIESVPGLGWRVRDANAREPGPSVPLHRRIAADVRRAIAEGRLPVGGAVPSEGDLSKEYAVSRPTVRRALAELEGAGLVETQHGRGRFVRAIPQPEQKEDSA